MELNRPPVSRDTRLLLTIVLVSLTTLWVLARIRFPDQPATPNPVPPVLAQLAPPSAFEDIAASVARVEPRLKPSIIAFDGVTALRFRDDLAVALAGDQGELFATAAEEATELAREPASRLSLIRAPGGTAVTLAPWSPRRLEQPRFLMAADVSRDGLSLRPVFVGSLYAITSPVWSGTIWAVPASTDLAAGTFVFSTDGAFAGLVVEREGRVAIVPGETVIAMAERLASRGPSRPGQLGIHVQALTPDVAAATGARLGAVVTWVDSRGPAAGQVTPTDVIEEFNGQAVATLEDWEAGVARLAEGEQSRLKVRRRGELLDLSLAAAAVRPDADMPLGLSLRSIRRVGAEVIRVAPESAAFRAGLAPGDVITLIGGLEAPTAAQVSRIFAAAGDGPLLVGLTRGETHHVMTLKRKR